VRILLATVYPVVGGSSRILLAAAAALRKEHEVVVRAPLPEATERLHVFFPVRTVSSPWQKLQSIPRLLRIAASEIGQLRGRRFDFIYVHDEPSLYVYGLVSRFVGSRVVRHVHMNGRPSLFERLRSFLAHHTIHIARHAGVGRDGPVIRNSIAMTPIERRPVAGELVVAGSICVRKNQLLAVEALALLVGKGIAGRLRLCGNILEPSYVDDLRRRAEELGVGDRVSIAGFVPSFDYLASATCLLMPSLYENQPLALLEAIAARVPVIASDIAAHRELVELGCLDPRSLSPLTAEAFAAGVATRAEIESRYSQRVRELFSEQRFEKELLDYFRQIDPTRNLALGPVKVA
jgi:glycosyltransferase involved in cell wall biosynthesis